MSTIAVNITGKKKVLVIACPELAQAVYEALSPLIQSPEPGVIPSGEVSGGNDFTVSWLCEHIFPSPLKKKQRALSRAWQSFTQWGQGAGATTSTTVLSALSESPMSLFRWGDYDFVIIQDLWPIHSGSSESLECAGYVLANLDYYLWGNFSTKKIILVTDATFPLRKAKWIQKRLALQDYEGRLELILNGFDQKQAFELLDVTSPDLTKRLVQLLGNEKAPDRDHYEPEQQKNKPDGSPEIFDLLLRPVLQEVGAALQSYVGHQAEVLVVDDEEQELRKTFLQLTGRPLPHEGSLAPNRINVVRVSDGSVRQAESFDALVMLCEKEFQRSAGSNKPYTLLVTDILFGGSNWNKTGLDLIETLRQKSLQHEKARRTGIVAYTAFTTPFIAMSSYQRGADFVVAKKGTGLHDLKIEGSERLLMTLAFLCFQKSFLSNKRKEAGEIIEKAASGKPFAQAKVIFERLRQLQAVLPKYSVSIHLQQEWLDTCYLFEAMNVYGAGSSQLDLAYADITRKYD